MGPRALKQLADRIANDPDEIRRFLATDVEVIARDLRRYRQAPALIAQLRDRQSNEKVRAHLDAVLAAMGRE